MEEMTLEQRQALALASARLRMHGRPADASAAPAATEGAPTGSFLENLAAGAGKAVVDTGRGLKQLGAQGLNMVSPRLVSDETVAGIQADIDEAKALDKPLMDSGGGFTGNIAGNIATMALPGGVLGKVPAVGKVAQALMMPKTLAGGVGAGATMGAVQPVASDEDRLMNTGIGAAGGAVGQAVPKVVAAILGGNQRPQVQKLLDEGVKLTPGQILGGAAQRLEEGATSIPLVGDAIRSAMNKARETFNTAALNRALAPIGEKAAKVGRDGIEEVETKLGDFYDKLLSKITVKLDPDFAVDVRTIKAAAANLPAEQAAQFDKILNNEVLKKLSRGRISGDEMKVIESELGRLERGYRGDAAFANRELGHRIQDAKTALRAMVERGNPAQAAELRKANEGYANFVRVQRASSGVGAADGVFTPSQLSSAVKANDSSLRKGAFARGDALMEDLSDAGVDVMRKNVPDSGTPLRTMVGAGALGAGAYLEPLTLAALGSGAAAYTQPVQSVIRALLARRPEFMKKAGDAVRNAAPYGALPGAAVTQALMEQQ